MCLQLRERTAACEATASVHLSKAEATRERLEWLRAAEPPVTHWGGSAAANTGSAGGLGMAAKSGAVARSGTAAKTESGARSRSTARSGAPLLNEFDIEGSARAYAATAATLSRQARSLPKCVSKMPRQLLVNIVLSGQLEP